MKVAKGWYYFTAAVILLVLGKIFVFKSPSANKGGMPAARKDMPVAAEITVARAVDFTETVRLTGTVLPEEFVDLQPEVSGRVVKLNFREGSKISQGQLLVKINDAELQAQKIKTGALLANAKTEEQRLQQLWAARAISKDQYDKAVLGTETLKADLLLIQAQIDKTEIRAPFSGEIGQRNISAGAMVTPSTIIARLYQNNQLKIKFDLPVKYKSRVRPGQRINIKTETGQEAEAVIYSIEPGADAEIRTVSILAKVAGFSQILSAGQFVNVNLTLDKIPGVYMIPSEAVIPVLKGQRLILSENGKAVFRNIEVLSRNDSMVVVGKGLKTGDSVVTRGIMFLKPGSIIKPAKKRN